MQHDFSLHTRTVGALALSGASIALALTIASPCPAQALTAAEKQSEADAVYAQIDSLQTSLNETTKERDRAKAAYDEAVEKRDEAERSIQEETARIETLQSDLAQFAKGMYKERGSGTFLDVMLNAQSFDDFLTSWETCNSIFEQGEVKLDEAQEARETLEAAQADFQAQSERAATEMEAAEEAQAEIEATQAALREQAEQLSAEAAELQRQEELAAEQARQAEEARKKREAEIEAAAKAAEEERAQAAQQEEAQNADESESQDQGSDAEANGEAAVETTSSQPEVLSSGYFSHPCPGSVYSSYFGYRTFDNSYHMGLDMAASEGTPFYAADSGTVMYATNDGGYNGGAGNWVVIAHGNGIVTKYMHASATYVSPGDIVERGQNIGAVGNTGNSFGAHLHFQVEVNGVAVDPLNYL